MTKGVIDFMGAGFGWGAQERGTEKGPEALWSPKLEKSLHDKGFRVNWQSLYPDKRYGGHTVPVGPEALPLLEDFFQVLSSKIMTSLEQESFPFVIGGDHSIAIATWSALYSFVQKSVTSSGPVGLLWVDAHLDAHTPETTLSRAYHGMPVAALLGEGEESLVSHLIPRPKIQPENLVLIGGRSWEEGEFLLLKKKGVRLYTMAEIQDRGFQTCFEESLAFLEKATQVYGLSFDLDVFDPQSAPGVGSPEPGGLHPNEVFPVLQGLAHRPKIKALEIVEYNPEKDQEGKTKTVLEDLILSLLHTN